VLLLSSYHNCLKLAVVANVDPPLCSAQTVSNAASPGKWLWPGRGE
jgi:hypothetical protein